MLSRTILRFAKLEKSSQKVIHTKVPRIFQIILTVSTKPISSDYKTNFREFKEELRQVKMNPVSLILIWVLKYFTQIF